MFKKNKNKIIYITIGIVLIVLLSVSLLTYRGKNTFLKDIFLLIK